MIVMSRRILILLLRDTHKQTRYRGSLRAIVQDYFQATNACPMKQKLGKERRTGDHGKWICGVKTLLQKPGCIVYSVGSNGLTGQPTKHCMALMHARTALAASRLPPQM